MDAAMTRAGAVRGWLARHPWAVVAVLLALNAVHAWVYKQQEDFAVFHRAGVRFAAGDALYQLADGIMPFKYAPIVALLFTPLAPLSFRAAAAVWLAVTCGLLVLFLRWCGQRFGGRASWLTHLGVVLLCFPFIRYLFMVGQCDVALLGLVAASESQAERRPWLSGLLWALACLFKPPFLLFVLPVLLARQWRRLAWLPVGLAVGLLLPAVRYGFTENLHLLASWRAMLSGSTPAMLCSHDNQGLWGIVCRYAVQPEAGPAFLATVVLSAALVVGALGAAVYLLRRRPEEAHTLALAATFYLAALFSPLAWRTNFIGLAPMLYVLLRLCADPRLRWALVVPATSTVLGAFAYDLFGPRALTVLLEWRQYGVLSLATVLLTAWLWATRPAVPVRSP